MEIMYNQIFNLIIDFDLFLQAGIESSSYI